MNSAVITILSLSVSGSILALMLLAGKPLLKNRVSKAFSYYVWLLIILRLVMPVTAPVNIMGMLFDIEQPRANSAPTEQIDNQVGRTDQLGAPSNTQAVLQERQNNEAVTTHKPVDTQWPLEILNFIKNNLLWIWLAGAVASMGWFITAYICFSRRIRRSCVTPHSDDLAVFEQIRDERRIKMACSNLVSTPVLIGAFHPVIVLPQLAYVRNGMDAELKQILRHELTHYSRKDVLYKWLVAVVTSLHCFNPLMLWIRREIGRACELSCDEAVISGMSESEKQFYGNTLLTLSADRKLPTGILTTTLCEEKEQLAERLISIKKYKKGSTFAVALSLVLMILLTGCAVALGAATGSNGAIMPVSSTKTEDSSLASGSDSIDILNNDINFQSSGLEIKALKEQVKIDRATAIKNAEASVGESVGTQAKAITAVLVKITQDTPINPDSPVYLKDHPAWIVTFHGVTLAKNGPSKTPTVLADENVVIDAASGDVLESFAYPDTQPWLGIPQKADLPRSNDMTFAEITFGSDRDWIVYRMGREPDSEEVNTDGSSTLTYHQPFNNF